MLLKFEQIVWSELYEILSFLTKIVNNFWQDDEAILEDVSVTETIVWCYTTSN